MRVKYEDLLEKFQRILESRGFSGKHAKDAATVFANNSLDGVYSHGVNCSSRVCGAASCAYFHRECRTCRA